MTIRVSEDYSWKQMMYESDILNYRRGLKFDITFPTDYTPAFKSVEVSSFEEIEEYVSKGYAIKINC
jgi:hypothetical protein